MPLRPGLKGVSDNIRVISTVGRFLEHSRVYYFQNGPEDQQLYLGSADLMRRNLYNRVEILFPILDPRLRLRIMRLLGTSLADNQGAWELNADEAYYKIIPRADEPAIESQQVFMSNSFGLEILP